MNPEGQGVRERAEAASYTGWQELGKNLAAGAATPAEAVQDWLDSPGHCQTLMDPKFRELGVGSVAAPGSPYARSWVQNFGTR
ncbi:hypothetical protein DEIPH_ctg021orf0022 [Deinococcus phoenicis]|uniref:SCP domain-containing protein n=1 Tax=Deinococcus phoenicis TaxID=1476583 RepID=A0A016QRJ8_9DEIO|nr:hypothetical protein DEIPH_ctg021orf0022 [Deinococcus phoenicis]